MDRRLVSIENERQFLQLAPSLGGGVATWRWRHDQVDMVDLLRAWRGGTDPGGLGAFPMLPWVNRISGGGFTHDGRFYPVAPNRADQRYPIHGDGWLQAWQCRDIDSQRIELTLQSRCFAGNPHAYDATQSFELIGNAMRQSLSVTNRGEALPFGIGIHPWFAWTRAARLTAQVNGVWMASDDLLPLTHRDALPLEWDLCSGIGPDGPIIDNTFTGWDGTARMVWPEFGIALQLRQHAVVGPAGRQPPEFCQVYRPAGGRWVCVEPMTQLVDGFNRVDRPGVMVLAEGQTMRLALDWTITAGSAASTAGSGITSTARTSSE